MAWMSLVGVQAGVGALVVPVAAAVPWLVNGRALVRIVAAGEVAVTLPLGTTPSG